MVIGFDTYDFLPKILHFEIYYLDHSHKFVLVLLKCH